MANAFKLDVRLDDSCFVVIDLPLSRVLLKNNLHYPWLILVPRRNNITEITQLSKEDSCQLMEEIRRSSAALEKLLRPDKINIGSLGNIVSQLHIHIIARFKGDKLWPQGVWQSPLEEKPYCGKETKLITSLVSSLSTVTF